jgi:hypothetical protein
VVILQRITAPIQGAASEDFSPLQIDGFYFGIVQVRRGNQFADGGIDLLRLHFAGEHLRDHPVHRCVIIPADHGQLDFAALDQRPKRSSKIDSDPPPSEA